MKLFDLIKIMFTSDKKYQTLKTNDKSTNSFMVNRFMSIKYPTNAQKLNFIGYNGANIVDLWQIVTRKFNRTPGWIFTKTKKTTTTKTKLFEPDKDLAKIYMTRNNIGKRELNELLKFHNKEMELLFKRLKAQIEVQK